MDPKNKLGAMPVRPLLYTIVVPLMLSLLIQSLYNIVDSIFVARLSETALTAASLVYAIQFLMIAIGVGTAVGLNALLSRKLGQKKPEEACRATTGLFLMPVNGLGQAAIPVVGYNYGSKQSDRVKQAWKVLLPTGIVFALCGTAVFLLFPRQLLGLFSASEEMLTFGVPALRIISVTFLFAVITMRGMVFFRCRYGFQQVTNPPESAYFPESAGHPVHGGHLGARKGEEHRHTVEKLSV